MGTLGVRLGAALVIWIPLPQWRTVYKRTRRCILVPAVSTSKAGAGARTSRVTSGVTQEHESLEPVPRIARDGLDTTDGEGARVSHGTG